MIQLTLTPHQAKYFAYDLTRRAASGMDRLSMALFDAAVDLNPHQIEAALFALQSPLSKGVMLADEVGSGKNDRGRDRTVSVLGGTQAPPACDLPGFTAQAVGSGTKGEVSLARSGPRCKDLARRQAKRPDPA